MMPVAPRSRIAAYLVLTFAFSSIFYVRIISAGRLRMLPVLGLMWCPGVSAMIVRLVSQRTLDGIGWSWRAPRWQFVSYLLPPLSGIVVYGAVWLTGAGGFNRAALTAAAGGGITVPLPVMIVVLATAGFLSAVIFALGEEIGWRGFLVPELARVSSFRTTALVSGAVWAVYHYPLILFADYNGGSPKWFGLLAFTWMILASSFVYAWLRLRTGSVWTGVTLHASHNLFIQQIFDPLTSDHRITKYLTGEFGVGLAIVYSVLAIYFSRRRHELASDDRRTPRSASISEQPADVA
jgi:CAAX protease family protein